MGNSKVFQGDAHYLHSLHIDAFGGAAGRDLGPFTPGMNVVFGANEAGKTTSAAFVGGVLFGWEEARGKRNVYKPANAQRSGTLVFSRKDGSGDDVHLSRARNADGVVASAENDILGDIDRDTYRTVFSLDSDQLRRLGKTSDVTARLLTAGAGTVVSPARALDEIDQRLAVCLSRSANYQDSIPNCTDQLEEVRRELGDARRETDQLMREDREFKELEPRMRELDAALFATNEEVTALAAQRDAVAKLDAEALRLREREADLDAEEAEIEALVDAHWASRDDRLPHVDAVEERAIREGMEELADERNRLDSAVSLAKREYASSQAYYEALCEADDIKDLREQEAHQRKVQIGLTVVTPLLFALIGVPTLVHGRLVGSLSFMAAGAMLIVFSICIALVAVVFMLFRPERTEADSNKRLNDAQWVMLQDRKKLEAMTAERAEHDAEVERYLESCGLQAASGNLRRARALLDAAAQARSEWLVLDQRRQSLTAQRVVLDEQIRRTKEERSNVLTEAGLDADAGLEALDLLLQRKQQQRDAQLQTSASYNARYGELRQELSAARNKHDFDQMKLRQQALRTRRDDTIEEYARLLLARRLLTSAIAAWESHSQPRVYQQASRLLSLMTDGRWVEVGIDDGGGLRVLDALRMERHPSLLSLGTCQQLYLALRIALLMTAENVGRSIPVLADDILVNFDDTRRRGAALALAELAAMRQVIIFTCHEEVVRLMQESCSSVNLIRL